LVGSIAIARPTVLGVRGSYLSAFVSWIYLILLHVYLSNLFVIIYV
jgi:hypothetical protein